MFSVYSSSVRSAVLDFTRLAVGNLWFTLFWFCSDFLFFLLSGKARAKLFFPPFSRMLVCLINIFKGLLVFRQYPRFCSECLVYLWSSTTMNDYGSTWLLRAGFPWWNDEDEPWEGSACRIFPPPNKASRTKKKWEEEKIPGEPQEASVGGHISLAAANELP